jgi:hypothetical protein
LQFETISLPEESLFPSVKTLGCSKTRDYSGWRRELPECFFGARKWPERWGLGALVAVRVPV